MEHGEKKMEKEVVCKNCDKGIAWFDDGRQTETGTTTKGMKRAKCSCCRGNWWDCKNCAAIELKKKLGSG